jgi:hypothetical protein
MLPCSATACTPLTPATRSHQQLRGLVSGAATLDRCKAAVVVVFVLCSAQKAVPRT